MKSLALSTLSIPFWASVGAFAGDSRMLQDSNCTTIAEIVCDNGGEYPTDTLCEAVLMAGIQGDLETETWTLFAPIDDAFESMPSAAEDVLMGGPTMDNARGITEMLAFHLVEGVAMESTAFKCDELVPMANEEYSVTICEGDRVFQVGIGNLPTQYPEITVTDIQACNGVIHLVNEVILFDTFESGNITFPPIPTPSPSEVPTAAPTDGPSAAPSGGPSPAPSVMPSDGPSPAPSVAPSGGPTGKPSVSPSDGPSSAPSPSPTDDPSQGPTASPSVTPPVTPIAPPSALSVMTNKVPTTEACSINEIVCDSDEFTYLCTALSAAGLTETFDDYSKNITLFAPNDSAFEELGEVAISYLLDPDNVHLLIKLLAFHAVLDKTIYSEDLICKETIEMANGKDSRSVCRGDKFYQKGKGNSDDERPEVIEVDIETCNGVMHVISEVMLFDYIEEIGIPPKDATFGPMATAGPSKAPIPCLTVDQVVCEDPDFSILCGSLEITGLAELLKTGTWTMFAPNNEAFLKLPPAYVQLVTSDDDALSRLLLLHVAKDQVLYKDDLPCVAGENLIEMANGKDTRTLCKDIAPRVPVPKYQKGRSNPRENAPEFVAFDLEACNGVVHELDGVMLHQKID